MPLSPSSIEHTSAAPPQPSSTSSFSTPTHHDALHSLDSHEPDELPQADLRNGRGPKGRAAKGRGQTLKLDWGTPQRRAQHDDDGQASDATDEDDHTSEDTADKEQTSPLLHLPSETLIHLTSFLPPSSLITLLLVCKHLNSAVSYEVAWRSSYEFNFLSGDSQAGGLMRSCLTGGGAAKGWKKEAVGRERFLYRMAHSRSPSLLHDPRLAQVHSFALSYPLPPPGTPAHQMKGPALLSASLIHGICSRSDPSTGKVVKGYVDSHGSTDQQALFNPNNFVSPVTALLLSPLDPSLVIWGFQDGHVAQTHLLVGLGRTPSRSLRSAPADGHFGATWCVAGASGATGFLSGGEDGRVKLWASVGTGREERLTLLWTGDKDAEPVEASGIKRKGDAVVKVCWDANSGTAVGVTESGQLRVWTGLGAKTTIGEERTPSGFATWREDGPEAEPSVQSSFGVALALDVETPEDGHGPPTVHVLVHLVGRPSFLKVTFDFATSLTSPTITTITFAPAPNSPSSADLTTIHAEFVVPPSPSLPLSSSSIPTPRVLATPVPTPNVLHLPTPAAIEERIKTRGALGQSKFVVAGDSDGWVRMWDWSSSGEGGGVVEPLREWSAGETKITALSCAQGLVMAGSISGILTVHDPLTLPPTLLRSFSERAASRHSVRNLATGALDPDLFRVSQIVLERDLIVASVGSKILSWRIGRTGGREGGGGKSPWSGKVIGRRAGGAGGGVGKGRGGSSHQEIRSEIFTARKSHEAARQLSLERENRHSQQSDRFVGDLTDLTEEENLAYVMMLSREEEERRTAQSQGPSAPTTPVEDPNEDEEDRQLRLALEASLTVDAPQPSAADDHHYEDADHDQEELLDDDYEDEHYSDDDDHEAAYFYTESPILRPQQNGASSSSSHLYAKPHGYSRNAPSPQASPTVSATFPDDIESWPTMSLGTPVKGGNKGKQSVDATPVAAVAPRKLDWSKVAAGSGVKKVEPTPVKEREVVREREMTLEEQEDEELRLVLEMSLKDA